MKYTAIFLKKNVESEYRKIGKKRFKPTDETFRFKNKTFIIPKSCNTYTTNKECFIFFDYDKSHIITFIKNDIGIDYKMLDKLLSQDILGKLIRQLRVSMEEPNKWKMIPLIISFIFGAIMMYAIYPSLMKSISKQIIEGSLWLLKQY